MSKSYEATGKTREEAIDAGLEALGLTIGEVNVDVVEEGSKGLFGLFGSRPWRVRLTVIEQSSVLDTHSLFADSLEEKKPAPKKQPARKPQAEAPAKPAQEKPAQPVRLAEYLLQLGPLRQHRGDIHRGGVAGRGLYQ